MRDRINEAAEGRELASGRYILSSRLGGGGTADVYRAVDTLLDRSVAIKMFRPGSGLTDEQRFEREARLLAPLDHPGLVTIYDAGVDDDRAYLVLQLVEGVTLRQRLARGRLSPAEVTDVGARLAEVLAYVHGRGIVHRDIKPSNVLLSGDGSIGGHTSFYLADFGISRLVDTSHLTATGLVVGTVAYMAPEQVRGMSVGPAADLFALGLVMLECLTGHTEYSGGNAEAAVARLSRRPSIPAEIPEPLRWVLGALTNLDPVARLTAVQCAAMLRDGGAGYGEATTAFLLPDPPVDNPLAVEPAVAKLAVVPRKPSPRPRRPAGRDEGMVVPLVPSPVPASAVPGVPPPLGVAVGGAPALLSGPRAARGESKPGAVAADSPDADSAAPPDAGPRPELDGAPDASPRPEGPGARDADRESLPTEPRVVPVASGPASKRPKRATDTQRRAGYSNDYPPVIEAKPVAAKPDAEDASKALRGLLRRSWPWAAAGCLVLTIILATNPEKDVRPNPQPYTITTPKTSVSPGAANQKPVNAAGTKSSSSAQGNQVGMPIDMRGATPPRATAAPPTGQPSSGAVVPSPIGQPSLIPDPPSPSPAASQAPVPCPTKKNGKCKHSKPPVPPLLPLS